MRHAGELEVVHVVTKMVRHRGDQRGLAGPGRAVEEVAALPRAADPRVEFSRGDEGVQVGEEEGAEAGVEGEGLECGVVAEGDGGP